MNGSMAGICLAAGLALLTGCTSAQKSRTQLPSLAYGDPRAERRAYETHDPLPEENVGPYTGVLPRNFDLQRSEPRRTMEKSASVRYPTSVATPAANYDPNYVTGGRYTQTVTP